MPSFDIVSKTDLAEVDNAINSAMREITARYDFKNSQSKISRESDEIELMAEDQYKIDQVQQIFRTHLVKRKVSTGAFDFSKIEDAKGGMLRQKSKIIQGIEKEISQLINKKINFSEILLIYIDEYKRNYPNISFNQSIQNEVYMEVDAKWQLEYINNILM